MFRTLFTKITISLTLRSLEDFYRLQTKTVHLALTNEPMFCSEIGSAPKTNSVLFLLKGMVTEKEFETLKTAAMEKYFIEMKKTHPRHRDRYSEQTWLPHGGNSNTILKKLRERWDTLEVWSSLVSICKVYSKVNGLNLGVSIDVCEMWLCTWLWGWPPLRPSKRQSLPPTVYTTTLP